MGGVFQYGQPIYDAVGIPTFPVGSNKRPAVSHYARIGAKASRRLAERFGDAPALGFMLPRARLAIVDVDSPDERVAADAMSVHGRTPIVVRSVARQAY
jgi:hypothetical protein